jgi:hypothetical protein
MIRMSQKALLAFFTLSFGVSSLLIACTDDTTPKSGSSSGNDGEDSGTGSVDSSSSGNDGGGGKKALGEDCANDDACESGHCFTGGTGGGGGDTGSKCTLPCAVKQDPAPECSKNPGVLTGKCNGKHLCEPETQQ